MEEKKDYIVIVSETGDELSCHATYEEALAEVARQEAEDKGNWNYTDGYYGIRHGDEDERIENGGYEITEEDIAKVKEYIIAEAQKLKRPFFRGGDEFNVYPDSIEYILDDIADWIQGDYDQYVEGDPGDRDFDGYVDTLLDRVQEASVICVLEDDCCIVEDMLLAKAQTMFSETTPDSTGNNYEPNAYIDDDGEIRVCLYAGETETPSRWATYTIGGEEVTLERDINGLVTVTDYLGGEVDVDGKLSDVVDKAAPDAPVITENDLMAGAEQALEDFKDAGDKWYIDDVRGCANEWTLYLCSTDKQKAWAVKRGLREVDDEYAKGCIASANDTYTTEDNARAVVALTDDAEELN